MALLDFKYGKPIAAKTLSLFFEARSGSLVRILTAEIVALVFFLWPVFEWIIGSRGLILALTINFFSLRRFHLVSRVTSHSYQNFFIEARRGVAETRCLSYLSEVFMNRFFHDPGWCINSPVSAAFYSYILYQNHI